MAKPRVRPTEKQIEILQVLDDEALLIKALEAMHALNRRAKEKRDRANRLRKANVRQAVRDEIEQIYALKNDFLAALVESGRASVEVFARSRATRGTVLCDNCGNEWIGTEGECRRCGDWGRVLRSEMHNESWYVIECQGYRFHQPDEAASARMREVAVACEAHDPDQPQREIPQVGLTIEAQFACVDLLIERLGPCNTLVSRDA